MRLSTFLLLIAPFIAAGADGPAASARRLIEGAGIQGGLILQVGCGDGRLTAALRLNPRYVVYSFDTDAKDVAAARSYLQSHGIYGSVAVDWFDGAHLPCAEGVVNLVVADADAGLPRDEILRVLAPGGAAVFLGPGTLPRNTIRKPWPTEIDSWPHYLHGADNNAVAQDTVVGPPRRVRWVAGPSYARSHEINSSMAAMVSARGRLFYIWDDGPTGMTDKRFPANWSLIARDAFNGLQLWKRPMPQWGWRQWHTEARWDDPLERAKMLRHLPSTLPRRLVAAGDRVYVTLGYEAPVSVLDAATGEVRRELEGTALTDEILHTNGRLLLRVRVPDSPPDRDVWGSMPGRQCGRVTAVDAKSGRLLWQAEPSEMAPLTLAAAAGRAFYSNYTQVVCLDMETGKEQWRSQEVTGRTQHRGTAGTLVATEQVVLYAHPPLSGKGMAQLHAFAADTGKLLWEGPRYTGPGVTNPPDLFVADGLVWVGETQLPVRHDYTELRRQGFDPVTGKVAREVVVPRLISWGHHYRCYRSKATERFLLLPKRGVEFVDLEGQDHMRNDWLRAPCIYGMLPANGLLYVAPHQCVCYPGVLMSDFNALAPAASPGDALPLPERRLQQGPAWQQVKAPKPIATDDWPAYRRDARRTGAAATRLGKGLEEQWTATLQAPLTPPVVAGGKVLVAEKDAHRVRALDATTGKPLWNFTAGGRIDSPPTVHDGLVLFGSADGRVYCLRLRDGREVWRFLAAPCDRRVPVRGQLESVWPVHGSVLVQRDTTVSPARPVLYCTAGRSTFLDGGIHIYGLDPHTGSILHQSTLDSPQPDPVNDQGTAGYMDGARTDLLVSDGTDLYLLQERLRSDLLRQPAPMQKMGKEGGGFRIYAAAPERHASGAHLIATGGFLDDNTNEGKYWTYGNRWPGWDRKMHSVPAYGQLLVLDDRSLYGVHVYTENVRVRRGRTLGGKGQRLFARDHGATKDRWSVFIPLRIRAMVLAGDKLFVAGPPDVVPDEDPLAAIDGRRGARLWCVAAADGSKLAARELAAPPVFDGLIAAVGRLYVASKDGTVRCLGGGR